jgi:hypothetical protein
LFRATIKKCAPDRTCTYFSDADADADADADDQATTATRFDPSKTLLLKSVPPSAHDGVVENGELPQGAAHHKYGFERTRGAIRASRQALPILGYPGQSDAG